MSHALLQARFGLAYVFISHDLAVVKHIADRIAVMYLGKIVETAETEELFRNPRHPTARAAVGAQPDPTVIRERALLENTERDESAAEAAASIRGASTPADRAGSMCRNCPMTARVTLRNGQ